MKSIKSIVNAEMRSNRISLKLNQMLVNVFGSQEYRNRIEVGTLEEIEQVLTIAESKLDNLHRDARGHLSTSQPAS